MNMLYLKISAKNQIKRIARRFLQTVESLLEHLHTTGLRLRKDMVAPLEFTASPARHSSHGT